MTPQFMVPALGATATSSEWAPLFPILHWQFSGFIAAVFAVAMVIMHVSFAVCVFNDAGRLRWQGRSIVVLSPFVWGLAALVLGLMGVAFYWLCHYSRFSRLERPTDSTQQ